jgi:hypothetical protein
VHQRSEGCSRGRKIDARQNRSEQSAENGGADEVRNPTFHAEEYRADVYESSEKINEFSSRSFPRSANGKTRPRDRMSGVTLIWLDLP